MIDLQWFRCGAYEVDAVDFIFPFLALIIQRLHGDKGLRGHAFWIDSFYQRVSFSEVILNIKSEIDEDEDRTMILEVELWT